MKHIFFAFPGGAPGLALLLLRGSVALFLAGVPARLSIDGWPALLVYGAAGAIGLGFSVRLLAGLCAAGCAIVVWPLGAAPPAPLLIHGLDAAALALIGPGAFSIDARLFGRRTIHLAE